MNNFAISIFYGTKITKSEYENLTKKHNITNLYGLIYEKGLSVKDVGNINSWEQIIGEEIHCEFNESISLTEINNEFFVSNNKLNFPLSDDKKEETRKKLISLGITDTPKYYLFGTWD